MPEGIFASRVAPAIECQIISETVERETHVRTVKARCTATSSLTTLTIMMQGLSNWLAGLTRGGMAGLPA